ncbi:MAG TPA: sugar transferase [Catenuloplanes sp.]
MIIPEVSASAQIRTDPVETGTEAGKDARWQWESHYIQNLRLSDLLVGIVASVAALEIRFSGAPPAGYWTYAILTAVMPIAWVLAVMFNQGYDPRFLFVGNDEYQRILRSGLALTAAIAIGSYAFNASIARGYVLVAMPVATGLGLVTRYLHRERVHRAWARGAWLRRVVVVGHQESVTQLTRQLRHERYHGLDVVATCVPADEVDGAGDLLGLPVYAGFDSVARATRRSRADTVMVLACPELHGPRLRRLAWQLERHDVDLVLSSALLDVGGSRTTIRPMDGLPMLHVEHLRLSGARWMIKDALDRLGAAVALIVLAPVLLGCVAAVRLDRQAPGPVLFRQQRVGRDGRTFTMLKFRTMRVDAERRLVELAALNDGNGLLFKLRHDPRVSPVGRVLRRYSLDELPQLVNVLRGEMSLVGPRPPLPSEVAHYPADMHRRLVVKPGLTGLWQVSGRSDLSAEEAMRLDLRYVESWSLTLDLVIMMRTVKAVLRAPGAY